MVAREIGTGPIGRENGEITQRTAAIIAAATMVFTVECITESLRMSFDLPHRKKLPYAAGGKVISIGPDCQVCFNCQLNKFFVVTDIIIHIVLSG